MGQRQKNSRYNLQLFLAFLVLLIIILYLNYYHSETQVPSDQIENWINNLDSSVKQDDPILVDFVKQNFVFRSKTSPKEDGAEDTSDYEVDRLEFIEVLYDNGLIADNVPGFFVEVGANDGKQWTCSRYFDQELHWNGLVIEPYPTAFKRLIGSGRRVWYSNAAVASSTHPSMANFHFHEFIDLFGGLTYRYYKATNYYTKLQAIPLYTILLAIDAPKIIDVLILDTEGTELDILRTLPFQNFKIKTIVVEVRDNKEGHVEIEDFLQTQGYELVVRKNVPIDSGIVGKLTGMLTEAIVESEYFFFQSISS